MAVWSIIKKSNLEYSRLDPEYYKYKFLENDSFLSSIEVRTYQQLSKSLITKGETPLWRGNSYKSQGIPFLRSENLLPLGLNLDKVVYIDKNVNERMARSKVYPNDILLAIVGATIGVSGRATNEFSEYNTNQANAIIRPLNEKYSYYLAILNETKFIQLQMERFKGGGSRDNLDLHEVRKIKVPIPSKNILDFSYASGKQIDILRKESKLLYSQAEQILLEELGLKDLDLKDDLFYTTKLKEVKDNNRMDAEYYMPKYEYVSQVIKKTGYKRFDIMGKFSKNLAKRGKDLNYKYIEIGGIDVSTGDVSYKEMQGCELPTNAKLKVSGGELIISKVRPTRGAIAIVPDYLTNNCLCSGAFSIFKIKSPIREYIQVFLRSKIGKVLLGHASTGTQYPTITDEDVNAIPIPDLSKNVIENISNKIFNAHVKRESAKALLEQAKHKVEEMIEKEAWGK